MKHFWPHPLTSVALLLAWLLLSRSLHPAHLVLGTLLALGVPLALRHWLPDTFVVRKPALVLRLLGRLLVDIVVSNVQVARRILGPESAIRPKFVWVPLELRSPHAIAALAMMVTMTPGTLSADVSADKAWLLVHAFDVDDEAGLIAQIKSRYERPLAEVLP